jgi:cyclopropane fatty-acyl-phospholipid synthase-like methyltransferase
VTVPDEILGRLALEAYPRSRMYDQRWVIENMMGPNALWLTESIAGSLDLRRGMRVLDLGCGKALSSIFLARQFDVRVYATDLWISASENWRRIVEMGEEERIVPVHADARELPFADGFFDRIVSVDAYHYFGTDDLALERLVRLLGPDGRIGVVVPGTVSELESVPPEHLAEWWQPDFASFHSPDWWRRHWERSRRVEVETAELVPDGWQHWLLWSEACDDWARAHGKAAFRREAAMLRADEGRTFGFVRLVARPLA